MTYCAKYDEVNSILILKNLYLYDEEIKTPKKQISRCKRR